MRSGRLATLLSTAAFAIGVPTCSWAWIFSVEGGMVEFKYPPRDRLLAITPANDVVSVSDLFTVVKLDRATGTEQWQTDFPGRAGGVAVDASGDVLVAGHIDDVAMSDDFFAVLKLSGDTGAEIWRYALEGSSFQDEAQAVAVDSAGDVVATGYLLGSFNAVKIAGGTGTEIWRQEIAFMDDFEYSVLALDGSDDVVAAFLSDLLNQPTVVKFDGATGSQLWQRVGGTGLAQAIAADGSGNVLIAGLFLDFFMVHKLDGSLGTDMWLRIINGTDTPEGFRRNQAYAVTADASGNAIAAGYLSNLGTDRDFTVVKLDGTTGSDIWQRDIDGGLDAAYGVALLSDGDVVAAGQTGNEGHGVGDLAVMRLDAGTGNDVWQHRISGNAGNSWDRATVVAIDGRDDVIVRGFTENNHGGLGVHDFTVAKLNGNAAGRRIIMRDAGPEKRKIVAQSETDATVVVGSTGGAGDPTVSGGVLRIFNPTTEEEDLIPLPAIHWKALGTPPGVKGYQYTDRARVAGPCKKVRLKIARKGTQLKAVCASKAGGPGIAFSLDEPSQGSLGVEVSTGTAAIKTCMLFGGTVSLDQPGFFKAKEAPPADSCAFASPSAAFLDAATTLLD